MRKGNIIITNSHTNIQLMTTSIQSEMEDGSMTEIVERCFNIDCVGTPLLGRLGVSSVSSGSTREALECGVINFGIGGPFLPHDKVVAMVEEVGKKVYEGS